MERSGDSRGSAEVVESDLMSKANLKEHERQFLTKDIGAHKESPKALMN